MSKAIKKPPIKLLDNDRRSENSSNQIYPLNRLGDLTSKYSSEKSYFQSKASRFNDRRNSIYPQERYYSQYRYQNDQRSLKNPSEKNYSQNRQTSGNDRNSKRPPEKFPVQNRQSKPLSNQKNIMRSSERFYPQNRLPTGKFIASNASTSDDEEECLNDEEKSKESSPNPAPKVYVGKPGTINSIFKVLPRVGTSTSQIVPFGVYGSERGKNKRAIETTVGPSDSQDELIKEMMDMKKEILGDGEDITPSSTQKTPKEISGFNDVVSEANNAHTQSTESHKIQSTSDSSLNVNDSTCSNGDEDHVFVKTEPLDTSIHENDFVNRNEVDNNTFSLSNLNDVKSRLFQLQSDMMMKNNQVELLDNQIQMLVNERSRIKYEVNQAQAEYIGLVNGYMINNMGNNSNSTSSR